MSSEPLDGQSNEEEEYDACSWLTIRMDHLEENDSFQVSKEKCTIDEAKEIAAQKSVDGNPTSLLSKSWDDPPEIKTPDTGFTLPASPAAVIVPETPDAPPDAPKDGFYKSSNVGDEYYAHLRAMSRTETQEVGQSFVLSAKEYRFDLLKKIADKKSVGKKAFVVIEWDGDFEIKRLPDDFNPRDFYENVINADKSKALSQSSKLVMSRKIKIYVKSSLETCRSYDNALNEEIKKANIISRTYLHRSCGGLAAFKNSEKGSKDEFKNALKELEKEGVLTAVNESGKAKMYKINVEKLEEV